MTSSIPALAPADTQTDEVRLAEELLPRPARHLAELSLPASFVGELLQKLLEVRGRLSLSALADAVCLPTSVVGESLMALRGTRIVEIGRGGATEVDHEYQLTDTGRLRTAEALQRSLYAGPAPVSLEEYTNVVRAQSLGHRKFSAPEVRGAFADLILPPALVDSIGAAMNSGRSMLLYGPAGSGKTFMAEQMARLLPGFIAVPHAIYVGGEVVQVFDPLIHQAVAQPGTSPTTGLRSHVDRRWVICHRPFVLTGGELSLRLLDLQFDEVSGFYQAPPHVKANGGIFVVDDLGRQLVSPRELMNRWIVPLDRGRDYLTLHNGFKLTIPFDMSVVFSTNLHPDEIADDAFLRRFGYKILMGPVDESAYRRIFQQACADKAVRFDEDAFGWLLRERHATSQRPLLACYPRDLTGRISDFAAYEGSIAEMTPETLARAWDTYFVNPSPNGRPDESHRGSIVRSGHADGDNR